MGNQERQSNLPSDRNRYDAAGDSRANSGDANKRYDVIQSDVISVPRSAERGLELRMLSTAIRYRPEGDAHIVFTPKDRPSNRRKT